MNEKRDNDITSASLQNNLFCYSPYVKTNNAAKVLQNSGICKFSGIFFAFSCVFLHFSCLADEQRTNKSQIWPFLCHLSDFHEQADEFIAEQRPNDCTRVFVRYANERNERLDKFGRGDRLFSLCLLCLLCRIIISFNKQLNNCLTVCYS